MFNRKAFGPLDGNRKRSRPPKKKKKTLMEEWESLASPKFGDAIRRAQKQMQTYGFNSQTKTPKISNVTMRPSQPEETTTKKGSNAARGKKRAADFRIHEDNSDAAAASSRPSHLASSVLTAAEKAERDVQRRLRRKKNWKAGILQAIEEESLEDDGLNRSDSSKNRRLTLLAANGSPQSLTAVATNADCSPSELSTGSDMDVSSDDEVLVFTSGKDDDDDDDDDIPAFETNDDRTSMEARDDYLSGKIPTDGRDGNENRDEASAPKLMELVWKGEEVKGDASALQLPVTEVVPVPPKSPRGSNSGQREPVVAEQSTKIHVDPNSMEALGLVRGKPITKSDMQRFREAKLDNPELVAMMLGSGTHEQKHPVIDNLVGVTLMLERQSSSDGSELTFDSSLHRKTRNKSGGTKSQLRHDRQGRTRTVDRGNDVKNDFNIEDPDERARSKVDKGGSSNRKLEHPSHLEVLLQSKPSPAASRTSSVDHTHEQWPIPSTIEFSKKSSNQHLEDSLEDASNPVALENLESAVLSSSPIVDQGPKPAIKAGDRPDSTSNPWLSPEESVSHRSPTDTDRDHEGMDERPGSPSCSSYGSSEPGSTTAEGMTMGETHLSDDAGNDDGSIPTSELSSEPNESSPELWTAEMAGLQNVYPQFQINGKRFKHPALTPGWQVNWSRTVGKLYYTHPDYGTSFYPPVLLPSSNVQFGGTKVFALDGQTAEHLSPTPVSDSMTWVSQPSWAHHTPENEVEMHCETKRASGIATHFLSSVQRTPMREGKSNEVTKVVNQEALYCRSLDESNLKLTESGLENGLQADLPLAGDSSLNDNETEHGRGSAKESRSNRTFNDFNQSLILRNDNDDDNLFPGAPDDADEMGPANTDVALVRHGQIRQTDSTAVLEPTNLLVPPPTTRDAFASDAATESAPHRQLHSASVNNKYSPVDPLDHKTRDASPEGYFGEDDSPLAPVMPDSSPESGITVLEDLSTQLFEFSGVSDHARGSDVYEDRSVSGRDSGSYGSRSSLGSHASHRSMFPPHRICSLQHLDVFGKAQHSAIVSKGTAKGAHKAKAGLATKKSCKSMVPKGTAKGVHKARSGLAITKRSKSMVPKGTSKGLHKAETTTSGKSMGKKSTPGAL